MQNYNTIELFRKNCADVNQKLQEILDLLGINRLVLVFDSMGGSYVPPMTVYRNQSVGILPEPFLDGYDFSGWFLNVYKKKITTYTHTIKGNAVYRFYNSNAFDHFYTIDQSEANDLSSKYARNLTAYKPEGVAFYAYQDETEETVPVYRLFSGGSSTTINSSPVYRFYNERTGDHYYTLSESEKNELIQKYGSNLTAYKYENIGFYAYTTKVNGTIPVYKFFAPRAKAHFYTANESEKNKLISQNSDIWRFEGIAFYTCTNPTGTYAVPVYRFYSDKLAQHHFTANENEKNNLMRSGTWAYEGIAFYVQSRPVPGTTIPRPGEHFYTAYKSERDDLINFNGNIWTDEGVAFYAYASNEYPKLVPIYRFYSDNLGRHFFTSNETERNNLLQGNTWRYEGVAFYGQQEPSVSMELEKMEYSNYEYSNQLENMSIVTQTGTLTLYAKWVPSKIEVTLNPNGGTVNPEIVYVDYLGKFNSCLWSLEPGSIRQELPIPLHPARKTLSCWYYLSGDSIMEIDSSSILLSSDPIEISASWRDRTYSVSFDANGIDEESTPEAITEIPEDSDVSLSDYSLSDPDYNFRGWSTTPRAIDLIQPLSNQVISGIYRDMTVYAIWENKRYSIEYYDLIGEFITLQDTFMNVPDYLFSIDDMKGFDLNGFNHWNSTTGTYADYLKLEDRELIYNLASAENQIVSLYASSQKISNSVSCISTEWEPPSNLSIGDYVTLGDARVSAIFDPYDVEDVTDAIRIYPKRILSSENLVYLSFKYDGNETKSKTYLINGKPVPERIEIVKSPTKTVYTLGDDLNMDGIQVAVISSYDVASAYVPFDDLTFDPINGSMLNDAGVDRVWIGYQGLSTYQPIKISYEYEISELLLAKNPIKTAYREGENFDPTGVFIVGIQTIKGDSETTLGQNYVDVTSECVFEPQNDLRMNTKYIGVHYKELSSQISTIIPIQMIGDKILLDASIIHSPDKTEYLEGEEFDPTGMVLSLVFNTGSEELSATKDNCTIKPEILPIDEDDVELVWKENNPDEVKVFQSISVTFSSDNYVIFNLNSSSDVSSVTLNRQNTGLDKYVKYVDKDGRTITKKVARDNSPLTLENIPEHLEVSCYYADKLTSDVVFKEAFLEDYRSLLNRIDFEHLTSVEITSMEKTFQNCTSLSNVVLPKSIVNLGEGTFERCENISSLVLPGEFYVSFGKRTLAECSNLSSIGNSSKITILGEECIASCESLVSIDLDGVASNLPVRVFADCTSLSSVENSDKVTSIEDECFIGCTNLISMDITSATKLGERAFENCTSLSSLENTNSLTSIGDECFVGCTKLISMDVASMTNLGSRVFVGCTALSSLENTNGLTSIGNECFKNCSELVSIDVASATKLGERAFENCISLSSLENATSLASIGAECMMGCEGLISVGLGNIGSLPEKAFYGCSSLESIGNTMLVLIGPSCFYDCGELVGQFIGQNTTVGDYGLYGCSNLGYENAISVTKTIQLGDNCFYGTDLSLFFISSSLTGDIKIKPNYPWGLPEENITASDP